MIPFFSIVIPLYNKQEFISDCLLTVLNQEETDYEIIIVNDGSTDNSENEVLKYNHPKIKYFRTENNGAASARNYGIKKSQGTYIAFLDADDAWETFYLKEIRKLIHSFPEALVFSTAKHTKRNNKIFKPVFSFTNEENPDHLLLDYFSSSYAEPILHSSCCVVKKTIFEELDMFDTTIKSGQDTDLWIRIGLKHKIAFSKKICATYHVHNEGLFRTTYDIKNKLKLEKFEHLESNNPALKKYLDLNRFSLVILCKIHGYPEEGKKLKQKIDRKNLNFTQKTVLNFNGKLLQWLIVLKEKLELLNIRILIFK